MREKREERTKTNKKYGNKEIKNRVEKHEKSRKKGTIARIHLHICVKCICESNDYVLIPTAGSFHSFYFLLRTSLP